MARSEDGKNSVREILAKLDRGIDQARARRMQDEDEQHAPADVKPGQARPLRARPLRRPDGSPEPDAGGKWIGRPND